MSPFNSPEPQDFLQVAVQPYRHTAEVDYSDDEGAQELLQYEYNGQPYYYGASGEVLRLNLDRLPPFVPVEDPNVIESVLALAEADWCVDRARDRIAAMLSADDDSVFLALRAHMEYRGGRIDPQPLEKAGVYFYEVGHDESHRFYLGAKDGRLYRYEEAIENADDAKLGEADPNDPGYLGHF